MTRYLALILLALVSPALASADKLIVHEWGTFTSLQDENGRAIGGLNSSDEPLPAFVHRLVVNNPAAVVEVFVKNPRTTLHPDVTMRLETPVVYFYPPDRQPVTVDVSATFRGGVLSEFYPRAETSVSSPPRRLTDQTVGTLTWKSAKVRPDVSVPETRDHIWLAPREVAATPVSVGGQGEKYLFYRGIGHVEAPIRVIRRGSDITLHDNRPGAMQDDAFSVPAAWLAEFRPDGSAAFRAVQGPAAGKANPAAQAGTFDDADFAKDNTARLRAAMKEALIADGLFADEADAMLETWKNSYFKTGGQRLFFVVPKAWTDRVLPLTISRPCELTRVMIGRIELVTPKQREMLVRMADEKQRITSVTAEAYRGRLGRFADALILDELRQRPSKPLSAFARVHGIYQTAIAEVPVPTLVAPATQPVASR